MFRNLTFLSFRPQALVSWLFCLLCYESICFDPLFASHLFVSLLTYIFYVSCFHSPYLCLKSSCHNFLIILGVVELWCPFFTAQIISLFSLFTSKFSPFSSLPFFLFFHYSQDHAWNGLPSPFLIFLSFSSSSSYHYPSPPF